MNESSLFDDEEGPDLTPPGKGFELYRYKNAYEMRTKRWPGYYWARCVLQGSCPQLLDATMRYIAQRFI
jgi:hypothetical protein